MPRLIVLIAFLLATAAAATPLPALDIYNADFEAAGGPFVVPEGWTPFGESGFEGWWVDGDWKGQVGDPPPAQCGGLYQLVTGATPGVRYRLSAEAIGGGPQTPVRIGLLPSPDTPYEAGAFSRDHADREWATLSVEAVARSNNLIAILEFRNTNPDHYLIRRGAWDNVILEAVLETTNAITASTATGNLSAPAPTAAAPSLPDPTDLYASMANLWTLAWPQEGVRSYLATSHDPSPEGNTDYSRFQEVIVEDGEEWTVLRSFDGPGAITRLWFTEFKLRQDALIRVDIDGNTVVRQQLRELFGAHCGNTEEVFRFPLANRTSGGWTSYVPMPFQNSARVLLRGRINFDSAFYWQVNWSRFADGTTVRPFSLPLNDTDRRHLETLRGQWIAAGADPKPAWPGGHNKTVTARLPASATTGIWQRKGPGLLSSLRLPMTETLRAHLEHVRLVIYWDGAKTPAVDVPLDVFFTTGHGWTVSRTLLAGMSPREAYCYFPMAFEKGARVLLVNGSETDLGQVTVHLDWQDALPASTPLRFHANTTHDPTAGEGELFVPLEVEGQGHFAGFSAAMSSDRQGDTHYLEGDEYVWVDGASEPAWWGTGTEDYFTCGWYFFNGRIALPTIGAPTVQKQENRIAAYRIHVPDWIPFDESLKFGLEVGDATSSPETANYRAVCYYYLGPAK